MVKKGLPIFSVLLFISTFITDLLAQTKVFDKIIAKDGTGDYTTISTAISQYANSRKVFFIKNGTYKEKILIDALKTNIRLIGESADGVIITYDDYSGKSVTSSSTADSYTFRVEGNGFYAENITFQNTATQAQAVAIYTKADTIAFKNCKFLGYQDTHYADGGRQYFLNCETHGDVDFIFGNAAAIYDSSVIISNSRKPGYVTAPSQAVVTSTKSGGGTNYHGILIKNSKILAEEGLADNSCCLGRPWGPYSSSVFYRCKIANHIKPEGWSVWTTDPNDEAYNNYATTVFAEYSNTDTSGIALNTSQRVTWSSQLTSADTSLYTISEFLKGWDPTIKTTALSAPTKIYTRNDSVIWEPINGARGYVVCRNDSAVGFTVKPGFSIAVKPTQQFQYRVKSVNPFGALSKFSTVAVPYVPDAVEKVQFQNNEIYCSKDFLFVPENVKTEIYDLSGRLMVSNSTTKISLLNLKAGIYIIKVYLENGTTISQKIFKKE